MIGHRRKAQGKRKAAFVDQMRFDGGLGTYSLSVAPESIWIFQRYGDSLLPDPAGRRHPAGHEGCRAAAGS
jgi:hypothetical protein